MELTEVPKPSVRDHALNIVKGLISSAPVPFASGVAAEIFSIIITPPLQRRWEEWAESIAEGLVQLQEKVDGFSLEDLSENESFVTVVLKATHLAVRNHQQEKVEALRNAVLNSALPGAPEDDLQLVFLDLVDTLTPWHLRVLKLFDDPLKWADQNQRTVPIGMGMASTGQVLLQAYPELNGKGEFQAKIIKDLSTYGLAEIPSAMMTSRGAHESRTSGFGKQFLQFLTTPRQLE